MVNVLGIEESEEGSETEVYPVFFNYLCVQRGGMDVEPSPYGLTQFLALLHRVGFVVPRPKIHRLHLGPLSLVTHGYGRL